MIDQDEYYNKFISIFPQMLEWLRTIAFGRYIERMVKFISIDFENDKEFGFSGPSCEFFFNNKSYKYLFLIEKPSGEDTRGYILVRFSPREGPFQNELVDLCDGDYSFLDWNRILRKLISNEIENV